jgi:DNA primase
MDIEEPVLEAGAVYTVAKAWELELKTSTGWQLVKILMAAEEVGEYKDVLNFMSSYNGQENSHHEMVDRKVFAPQPMFLLRKSADRRIKELLDALTHSSEEQKKAEAARDEAVKKHDLVVKSRERADQIVTDLQNTVDRLTREGTERLRKMQQLELDLGKVRKDIGEREWDRIVGGAVPSP